MARPQGTSPRAQRLIALLAVCAIAIATAFAFGRVFVGHGATWELMAVALISALIASALLARRLRHRTGYGPAALAVVCLALGLILFFTFTFPANRATTNWTVEPANWDSLRTEWEYSHAAAALLYLAALCLLVWSALSGQPSRDVALFISH